jgi:chemotaxis response regulator CheB
LPVFRFDKAFGIARGAKAALGRPARGTLPDVESRNEQADRRKEIKSKRRELRKIRQELREIRKEFDPAEGPKSIEHVRRKKRAQQEIFQLERELLRLEGRRWAAKERAEGASDGWQATRAANEEPEAAGALPDFVIIGVKNGGTTFLYNLLTQHPHVEPAAKKEASLLRRSLPG